MLDLIWLVLIFPLAGVLINAFFSRFLKKRVVDLVSCTAIGLSFLSSLFVFLSLLKLPAEKRFFEKVLFPWIVSGDFKSFVAFLIDPLSVLMILTVSGVSFIIHIYSIGYMKDDRGYNRYFTYLNLFTFAMLLLVLANNYLLMYIGWEAVGLCSYLLIGFWYEKKSASDAGKKAFIVNRIGDFGFALGIILLYMTFHDITFTSVFHKVGSFSYGDATVTLITLLLFLGAVGKSAQIPLYVWLPDAMEGPTPVSALIHAATMVTAGVYMVARSSALYTMAPLSMDVMMIIGGVTAIYAALIALVQNDIKRVLAYSTISQLGYMFLALGAGSFAAGIFHLVTHAFFKALLFLAAGSVIHTLAGEQDMRRMGGLKKYMPKTYVTFIIAALALAGVFPFAGFFSKDMILSGVFAGGNTILWLLGMVTALLTAFYIFRLIFMTFHGEERVETEKKRHLHESPSVMVFPLIILAFFSAAAGLIGIPLKGWDLVENFLSPVFHPAGSGIPLQEVYHMTPGLEISLMILSLALSLAGILIAYQFYAQKTSLPERMRERFSFLYQLLYHKFYVDEFYDAAVVRPLKKTALFLWKGFDMLVIDGLVNWIAGFVRMQSENCRQIQTGYIRNYALSLLIGCVCILAYYLLK
jgi:NADH-quinone oxidoreductase subunit L